MAKMSYEDFKKLVITHTGIVFKKNYLYAKYEAMRDFRLDPYDINWSVCKSEISFSREFRRLLDKNWEQYLLLKDEELERI